MGKLLLNPPKTPHRRKTEIQVRKFNNWLRRQGSILFYDIDHPQRKQLMKPMVLCKFKIRKQHLIILEQLADKELISFSKYMRNILCKWIAYQKKLWKLKNKENREKNVD